MNPRLKGHLARDGLGVLLRRYKKKMYSLHVIGLVGGIGVDVLRHRPLLHGLGNRFSMIHV